MSGIVATVEAACDGNRMWSCSVVVQMAQGKDNLAARENDGSPFLPKERCRGEHADGRLDQHGADRPVRKSLKVRLRAAAVSRYGSGA